MCQPFLFDKYFMFCFESLADLSNVPDFFLAQIKVQNNIIIIIIIN